RWIGRAATGDNHLLPWPPRSPDLTPCDFFLWGFVKGSVYVPPLPVSLTELRDRITHALQTITADMLHRVWDEFDYRVDNLDRHIESSDKAFVMLGERRAQNITLLIKVSRDSLAHTLDN
ncbi:hypothetical protein Cfor_02512, partial [Coptotermes formosanus]